jgi:acyl-CoA thioester hydrolase
VLAATGARLTLGQEIWRGEDRLFAARVVLVAMDGAGRPRRIPAGLLGS